MNTLYITRDCSGLTGHGTTRFAAVVDIVSYLQGMADLQGVIHVICNGDYCEMYEDDDLVHEFKIYQKQLIG